MAEWVRPARCPVDHSIIGALGCVGGLQLKSQGKDCHNQDAHLTWFSSSLSRTSEGGDGEPIPPDRRCEVTDIGRPPRGPTPQQLSKTSSSEWNSSDELTGPSSEQEDSAYRSSNSEAAPPESPHPSPVPCRSFWIWTGEQNRPLHWLPSSPPLPGQRVQQQALFLADSRTGCRSRLLQEPSQTSPRAPANTPQASGPTVPRQQPTAFTVHKSVSMTTSPDQERSSPGLSHDANVSLTTYFSVDNCMTDTYRLRYHRKPQWRPVVDSGGRDQGDPGDTSHSVSTEVVLPSDLPKVRSETGFSISKPTIKWNPVTPRGLDEHGFL